MIEGELKISSKEEAIIIIIELMEQFDISSDELEY